MILFIITYVIGIVITAFLLGRYEPNFFYYSHDQVLRSLFWPAILITLILNAILELGHRTRKDK